MILVQFCSQFVTVSFGSFIPSYLHQQQTYGIVHTIGFSHDTLFDGFKIARKGVEEGCRSEVKETRRILTGQPHKSKKKQYILRGKRPRGGWGTQPP